MRRVGRVVKRDAYSVEGGDIIPEHVQATWRELEGLLIWGRKVRPLPKYTNAT
jgi:hypothetical protein